jgi:hypothetical protein
LQSKDPPSATKKFKKFKSGIGMIGSGLPEDSIPREIALQTAAFEEIDRATWHSQLNPIRPDLYALHRCVKCFHAKLRFGIVLSAAALASRRDLARALSAILEPLGLPISHDGICLHIIFLDKYGKAEEFRPVLPGGGSGGVTGAYGVANKTASDEHQQGGKAFDRKKTSAREEQGQPDSVLDWSDVSSTAVRVYVM